MSLSCVAFLLLACQPWPATPTYHKLDNGLSIVVLEDHAFPLVSVQVWSRAGSDIDPPDQPGVMHVVRRMLETTDSLALRERAIGARVEAGTLHDAIYFASSARADCLDDLLRLASRRIGPHGSSEVSLRRIAEVARCERRAAVAADSAWFAADDRLREALFPGLPYRRAADRLGDGDDPMRPDAVTEAIKRWCAPANTTLVIVGDVSSAKAIELSEAYLGTTPWRESPRRPWPDQPPREQMRLKGGACGAIEFAWLTPGASSLENIAIEVTMQRLCNTLDGELPGRLAADGRPAVRWSLERYRDAGYLRLQVRGDRLDAPRVERAMRESLESIAESTPDPIAYERARSLVAADIRRRRGDFHSRALELGAAEIVAGDILLAALQAPRARGLPATDMQMAARFLLATRSVTIAPSAAAPTTKPADGSDDCGLRELSEAEALRTLAIASSRPPPAHVENDVIRWESHTLPNGVELALCAVPDADRVVVVTRAQVDQATPGLAALRVACGLPALAPQRLADLLSYRGLELRGEDERDGVAFFGEGPLGSAEAQIELQARLLFEPVHPSADAAAVAAELASAALGGANPASIADAVLRFGGDPRAALARAAKRLEQPLSPSRVQVRVIGDIDGEALREAAESIWKRWPSMLRSSASRASSRPTASSAAAPRLTYVAATGDLPEVRISVPFENENLDPLRRETLQWLLAAPADVGGHIDLERRWRFTSQVTSDGRIVLRCSVAPEKLEEVIRGVLGRAEQLRSGHVPAEELEAASRIAAASVSLRLSSLTSLATIQPERLLPDALRDEAFAEAAQRVLRTADAIHVVVVGDSRHAGALEKCGAIDVIQLLGRLTVPR